MARKPKAPTPEVVQPVAETPVPKAKAKKAPKAKAATPKAKKAAKPRAKKAAATSQLDMVALAVAVAQALKATQTESAGGQQAELVKALAEAITLTKPKEKKTAVNRKAGDPWQPKDGGPKLKLKRKMYQHGILIDPDMETNEVISLMNELRPGRFCDGWVKVYRRRDKGIDIDYPIKTAAQRLKLSSNFGITKFKGLLERCIEEANNPALYTSPDED